ncbi:MAG: CehA/McbA family metallohydrolase, partial [Chloroflexota bacterium]
MNDIVFQGQLTEGDSKQHISHKFNVPDGIQRIHIELEYAPYQAPKAPYPNQISLSLFDPNGARGGRHNNADQSILLTHHTASKGYVPGLLIAGEWDVVLDTHRIMGNELTYTISVTLSDELISEDSLTVHLPVTPADRGPGWYRGDLHSHTNHTDGALEVAELAQYARDFNLDFLALTDHNTISPLAEFHTYAGDDFLTIGGMELTTYYGHCLALGISQWQEWRLLDGASIETLAQRVLDTSALFVIAHPMSIGDPQCTGCRWEFETMMPGIAPAVEIWNGRWDERNAEAVALYYSWLNEGHQLVCTAGTDLHTYPPPNVTGAAVNMVYAEHFTVEGVLNGIRKGNNYLTAGPLLNVKFTSEAGGNARYGDTLTGKSINYQISVTNINPGDKLHLIADGEVIEVTDLYEGNDIAGKIAP